MTNKRLKPLYDKLSSQNKKVSNTESDLNSYCSYILLYGLTIILLLVMGCGATKVLDIRSELDNYEGQQVTINGKVVETFSVPFVHKRSVSTRRWHRKAVGDTFW